MKIFVLQIHVPILSQGDLDQAVELVDRSDRMRSLRVYLALDTDSDSVPFSVGTPPALGMLFNPAKVSGASGNP